MTDLARDLRQGLRALWRRPGFSSMAILCLAIGIGVNTMIFTITNAILLRPLPFGNRARLVVIDPKAPEDRAWVSTDISGPTYLALRDRARSFEQLVALRGSWMSLRGAEEPERVQVMKVTPNVMAAVGSVPILLGRGFEPDEAEELVDRVALIAHDLWKRHYGGDTRVVGEKIVLDDLPRTIIGVLPPDLGFLDYLGEVWLPLTDAELRVMDRRERRLGVVGLLGRGISLGASQSEVTAIGLQLAETYPDTEEGWTYSVDAVVEDLVEGFQQALLILHITVGLVLLIACVNVANLLLARGGSRRREMAARYALGAGRARLVRLLLAESLTLALVGGVAGLGLAVAGTEVLLRIGPPEVPRLPDSGVDINVLAFTLGLSLLTGLIFGLLPALRCVAQAGIGSTLRHSLTESPGRHRILGVLVASEVALAFVLLIAGGLLLEGLMRLEDLEAGFEPQHVATSRLDLPETRYLQRERQIAFVDRALTQVRSLAGVEGAAFADQLPLRRGGSAGVYEVEGRAPSRRGEALVAEIRRVSEDYFAVMGIPVVRGRAFARNDDADGALVVLVNETLARRHWSGDSPLEKRLLLPTIPEPVESTDSAPSGPGREAGFPRRIVGVVQDVKHGGLGLEVGPMIYLPYRQNPAPSMELVVRSRLSARDLEAPVRSEIWDLDPDQSVSRLRPLSELLDQELILERFSSQVLGAFAAAALILAALGIYSVVLFAVNERTRELGLRIALGASAWSVLRLVLSRVLALIALGIGAGVVMALLLTRYLAGLLHGMSVLDPTVYVVVVAFLTAAAFVASSFPALRATRVDPTTALRQP